MISWSRLQYMPKSDIMRLQNKLLRNFIKRHIPYHPFYHKLFKDNKIRFSDIKTREDLKKIPFTKKEDIAPSPKNPKKYLDFILQPNSKLIKSYAPLQTKIKAAIDKKFLYKEYKPVHIHFTTGRSANSIPVFYTNYDLVNLEESGRRLFDIFNVSFNDSIINAFPYAPHLAFWHTFYAAKASNALCLNTGGGKVLGTEKIISSIESMKASLLVGMPGYVYHLIRTAQEHKSDLSSLRLVIFGGERIPHGLRSKLRNYLKSVGSNRTTMLSTYGFTEGKCAWGECKEESGYHLYPDFELIEVVDKNNETVNEGEKGEIVYTSLNWRGSVFLRYKTGDITNGIYYDRCQHCKRSVPRIDSIIERKSEFKEFRLVKIKGSIVNLNAFFPIMMSHKNVAEWQIEIKKKNNDPYEIDELVVYVAPSKNVDFEKLKSELKEKITAETEVSPEIINVGLKELLLRLGMETELKERRIVDKRRT